jgi:hypothetical protein
VSAAGQHRGQGHRSDQPDRPTQAPDDLDGHHLGGDHRAERVSAGGEQHQQGQRCPGIGQEQRVDGGGDVVPADREGAGHQLAEGGRWVGAPQLEHQRGLGHGHVVEHAQAAKDDARQQQPAK